MSYNVYPGWHRLNQVREMMMFATQNDQGMDLLERTEKGISFVYHMNELIKESKDLVPTLEWKTNSFDSALDIKPIILLMNI